jgi:hypothetical protein
MFEYGTGPVFPHRAAREDGLFRAICTKLSPSEQKQLERVVALLNRLIDP